MELLYLSPVYLVNRLKPTYMICKIEKEVLGDSDVFWLYINSNNTYQFIYSLSVCNICGLRPQIPKKRIESQITRTIDIAIPAILGITAAARGSGFDERFPKGFH